MTECSSTLGSTISSGAITCHRKEWVTGCPPYLATWFSPTSWPAILAHPTCTLGPPVPLLFPDPNCECTWGTPSQSSACCMASRAFSTGWLGSQAAQSGQRPAEMVESDNDEGEVVSQRHNMCSSTPSRAVDSHPLPPGRFLLTPHVMAHRLGCPSLFRGRQSLPAPTMRPFYPG